MQMSHTLPRPSTEVSLKILAEYTPGKKGFGLISLAKKYRCEPHAVQDLVRGRSQWARDVRAGSTAALITPEEKRGMQQEGILTFLRAHPGSQIAEISTSQELHVNTCKRLVGGLCTLGLAKKVPIRRVNGQVSKQVGYEAVDNAELMARDSNNDPFSKENDVVVRWRGANDWQRGEHSYRMGLDAALFGKYKPPKAIKPRQARK